MGRIIFLLFFILMIELEAQPFQDNILTSTATVQNINLGTKTVGDTANSTLEIALGSGFMDFIVNSIELNSGSNTTLLPNESIIGDSVINADNTDAFIITGDQDSTLIVNADSSYRFSNISTELNPNPNFDFSYTDVLSGWDFTSGWSNTSTASISDNNTFVSTGVNGIQKNSLVTTSDICVLNIAGTTTATSGMKVLNYGGTIAYTGTLSSSFSNQTVFSANNAGIYLANFSAGTTDITSMSLKKLVAPDGWTASTMNATNYVIQDDEGMRLVSDGIIPTYIFANILTVGHTYKITVTANVTTNGLSFYAGGDVLIGTITSTGTQTFTFTQTTNATFKISKRSGMSANVILSVLSITEVFTESSAKLPLLTEEYAWYEASLSYQKDSLDASPIVTFNDNTSFTLNPISATWQDTVLGFWGAVEDDYLYLNGTSSVITIADDNSLDFGTNDFSISFTFKPENITVDETRLFSKRTGTTGVEVYESPYAVGKLDIFYGGISGYTTKTFSNYTFNDNQIYIIDIIFSQSTNSVVLYVNNSLIQSVALTYATYGIADNAVICNVGRSYASSKYYKGDIYNFHIINNQDTVLNLNGADGNISSTTWTDVSGNGNDGTISGATWMKPPFLTWSTDDTCKVNFKINSIEQDRDHVRVRKDNDGSIGLSTDISTVGSFVDNGTVHTTLGDYPFTVTSEVIPSSNVLHAPESLVASENISGIGFSWTDINVPDTNLYLNQTFDVELEQDLLWTQNNSYSVVTSTADRLRITRGTTTSQYQSAWIEFDDLQSYTEISFTGYVGTALKTSMAVYGYTEGVSNPATIFYQESDTNITFHYNYDLSSFYKIKIFAQIITNTAGQYGTFDNLVIYNTSPSYDNWVLKLHDWYNGYMINEWYIGATGTVDTNYQVTGLADGDKLSGMVGFVYDGDTLWSDVDTATYSTPITEVSPTEADFYVGNEDGTGSFLSNSEESYIPFSHFYDYYSDSLTETNQSVYFVNNTLINYRLNPSSFQHTPYVFSHLPNYTYFFANDAEFTCVDTVWEGSETSNWVYATDTRQSEDGYYPWKYRFDEHYSGTTLTSLENTGYGYFALDSVYMPLFINPYWHETQDYFADSTFYKPCADYPYSMKNFSAEGQRAIYVYTASSTLTPPEVYGSMLYTGNCDTLVKFVDCDNLTVEGFTFVGGSRHNVSINRCDNTVFKHNNFLKGGYRAVNIYSCNYVSIDSNYLNTTFDQFGGGRIYYEAFSFQGGIEVHDYNTYITLSNNLIENFTSSGFSSYARTGSIQGTNHLYVYGNTVQMTNKYLLPYFRCFQLSNENGATSATGMIKDVHIFNNVFKHQTIEIKLSGARDLYIYNNIFEDMGVTYLTMWDHDSAHYAPSVQPIFSLGYINTFPAYEYPSGVFPNGFTQTHIFANNTFINIQESMYSRMMVDYRKQQYEKWYNNLFANVSTQTANNYTAPSDDGIFPAYHLDFAINEADRTNVHTMRNNYSYNDDTGSGDYNIVYSTNYGSTKNYINWTTLNSLDVTLGTGDYDGNIFDISSTALNQVVDSTNNYMPTSLLQAQGYTNSELQTMYGANAVDRWGNQITNSSGAFIDGTINIGANNSK